MAWLRQLRRGKIRDIGKPDAQTKITMLMTNGQIRLLARNDANAPAWDVRLKLRPEVITPTKATIASRPKNN